MGLLYKRQVNYLIQTRLFFLRKILIKIILSRSTPRMDGYWGGKNDLIAAVGFEKDGVTTIAFRKKLKGALLLIFLNEI